MCKVLNIIIVIVIIFGFPSEYYRNCQISVFYAFHCLYVCIVYLQTYLDRLIFQIRLMQKVLHLQVRWLISHLQHHFFVYFREGSVSLIAIPSHS